MRYEVKLDFDYFEIDDPWGTAIKLPNGAVFSFWNCKIKYVNSNLSHYLLINSEQQQNIEEAIILLSFFTTIPLVAIKKDFYLTNEDYSETQKENVATKTWCDKLEIITLKLKAKRNIKHRDTILSLMQMCSFGVLHEYREHEDEQFFMYFKSVEKLAKLQIDNNRILQDTSGNRKEEFKKFLEEMFNSDFSKTRFDDSTLEEISGSLNGVLEKYLKSKNHRRIVLALSSLVESCENVEIKKRLRKIDSSRIQQLVKIRNGIAHGNIVSININDLGEIEFLARQMISIYYFGENFERYSLSSKKFNIQLW
ncbi:hypothetical protein [Streptococcus sp. sy018]|uniref:hypothetical protein n=1 Tax=Streptococcus sp. sy018 TaxID=2600147 RepID=UPI0011B75E86|nr:hypothetical protein [Streptococcus sp. sy018]TWS95352.1 hypothetical protein FRX52_00690 [Streptococcus sp. sy018]